MEGKMTDIEYLEKKLDETNAKRNEEMDALLKRLEHMFNPDKFNVPYAVAEFGITNDILMIANDFAQLAEAFKKEHRQEGLDLVSEQLKVLVMEALEVVSGLQEAVEKGEVVRA